MQVHIDSKNELERERIVQRLMYSLNARREDIDCVRLSLAPTKNALGAVLFHCHLYTRLRDGQVIELDETQSSSDLALTRALERCARTARRHLYRLNQTRRVI